MLRRWIQVFSVFVTNGYLIGFWGGTIYQGPAKFLCHPGLNCYSCPGALMACPIGTAQHLIGYGRYRVPFLVLGFVGILGACIGRMVCGWVCPFGFLQDALYKVPSIKLKVPRFLTYFKYVVLVVGIAILPGIASAPFENQPWFCKLCPAGTLEAGLPLVLANPDFRSGLGLFFAFKIVVLVGFLMWMICAKRPFCRTVCPLGAFYSLFNRVSLFRLHVDEEKCIQCGYCRRVCPMGIDITQDANQVDCIRCLDCLKCPAGAITKQWGG